MMKTLGVVAASLALASVAAADPKTDREKAIEEAKKAGILGPKGVPEVAELAKLMAGAWTCDGNIFGPDGKAMKITGHMTNAVDLNGTWLHESLESSVGEGKAAMSFRFEGYITFDAALKKWRRIEVDSFGSHTIGTADPAKGGKVEWVLESTAPDGKREQSRTHFDGSDPKKIHVTGDVSHDSGKTFAKGVDISCKK